MSQSPIDPRVRSGAPGGAVRRPHGARSRVVAATMSALGASGLVVWMAQRSHAGATATANTPVASAASSTPVASPTSDAAPSIATAPSQSSDDNGGAVVNLPPVTAAPRPATPAPAGGLPTRSLTPTRGS
jgi:hypothetical protein